MTNIMIELHFICCMLSISINKIVFSYCWEIALEMDGGSVSFFSSFFFFQAVLHLRIKGKKELLPEQYICSVSVSYANGFHCLLSHCLLQTELGFCNYSSAWLYLARHHYFQYSAGHAWAHTMLLPCAFTPLWLSCCRGVTPVCCVSTADVDSRFHRAFFFFFSLLAQQNLLGVKTSVKFS